ncbi:hypothetical protein GGI19_000704 [Coemansia pectinata]|uniref:Uncharacterized protein n=1 Tax=Coemansia pectinata TaxID=1052879 RepID=A0A9W8H681_9FUNG|nr:hypothetical protein GGI19_000704 [Coemansia pectinata]
MVPMLDEIRVATKVYGRPPEETSDQFGSFVSQLYRLANRIAYGCTIEDSIPVVLRLDGICNLVHINYKLDEKGQQFAQLAWLNASTLQPLAAQGFVKYSCLHTLRLTEHATSKEWWRITFKGAAPFPKLRHLYFNLACTLSDDTLFRGNAATLEFLEINLDKPIVFVLNDLNVFTPGSHPKLKCVKVKLMDGSPHFHFDTMAKLIRYILSIGSEVPVCSIDGNDPFVKLTLDLAPLHDYRGIQVLSLANTTLNLWRVIDLIKALPLLSDLCTLPPSLGQIPAGVSLAGLPAYVCANYSPMGERFRCWRIERYRSGDCVEIAKCVSVLALACPNFNYAAPPAHVLESFMRRLEDAIASDEFKPYEAHLQRLMFRGWIERLEY